ncbi:polysaccharide pyruvyl transferase family protein [Ketogulonicigenium vulgare]|uniref:Polysaccharide pyruvyl transferase domain-containing protein n=1 Tax=Ketogulonicigenium vulgare (strain WSH-001) TaxID=759362 RepID=F9Y546_KETVW|nr:polysaccharide pyruvyl transferase family protein [Ketogulonicigenium vulgare]ADO42479.1 conserved hypothetical protein [Ketogulonicigenium vulgare Y25]AEM40678.1 hypothetical protein KVU_0839 [Ketogulonicigenium vulgare WSH-001]ALJ80849.1 hypothetical protein KVH_06455 [Ketogulonicigenium vulgare]ANW33626.1 hypothetical protein KvSKV_06425 [Ketogulonicigenium vulgare]AOZ54392.1 hypothetical protein KVC_1377 [Ketogulonicigenium vulgare]
MKIGLLWKTPNLGMYSNKSFDELFSQVGHNNGNLAFVHSIMNQIDAEFIPFAWGTPAAVVNEQVDMVVFPGANQLGKHTDLGGLADNMSKYDKPVIAIGLGAQADDFGRDIELKEGTRAWLDCLIENGKRFGVQNIYTRGPFTTEQIKKLTGVDTFSNGCPSHFLSENPNLGKALEANWNSTPLPKRVAVAGGHESWGHVRTIEQQLVAMMMDVQYPGVYVVQSMADMVKISRGDFDAIEPEKLEQIRKHIMPHYSIEEFKTWANNYARSYYDIYAWMDDMRRHDLLIGPRFHGAQLALQAERMACCITIDSRTEEMCRETGVPFLRAADLDRPLTRATVREMIKFDGAAYDAYRAMKAGRYVNFLQEAGLKPAAFLHKIASA